MEVAFTDKNLGRTNLGGKQFNLAKSTLKMSKKREHADSQSRVMGGEVLGWKQTFEIHISMLTCSKFLTEPT